MDPRLNYGPHIFSPYLRSNWHALSVKGDLRSQYTSWKTPASSGDYAYSYLKCETMGGKTPLEFVFHNNRSMVPSTGEFSYTLIYEEVVLYPPKEEPSPPPPYSPPEWEDADFSPVTVVPGGMVRVHSEFTTPDPRQTLVIRVKLEGAPLWVQSLSFGDVEGY